jgi:hypothetical protein
VSEDASYTKKKRVSRNPLAARIAFSIVYGLIVDGDDTKSDAI